MIEPYIHHVHGRGGRSPFLELDDDMSHFPLANDRMKGATALVDC